MKKFNLKSVIPVVISFLLGMIITMFVYSITMNKIVEKSNENLIKKIEMRNDYERRN